MPEWRQGDDVWPCGDGTSRMTLLSFPLLSAPALRCPCDWNVTVSASVPSVSSVVYHSCSMMMQSFWWDDTPHPDERGDRKKKWIIHTFFFQIPCGVFCFSPCFALVVWYGPSGTGLSRERDGGSTRSAVCFNSMFRLFLLEANFVSTRNMRRF